MKACRCVTRGRGPLLLFVLGNLLAAPAAAQEPAGGASTTGDCSPIVVDVSGEVTINVECRLPLSPKELEELKEAVATLSDSSERLTALPADLLDRHERLSRQFGVQEQALKTFFRILNEENVSVEDLDAKLREIARRHRQLLIRMGELEAVDKNVAKLRDRAIAAIENGDYDAADVALKEAQDAQDKLLAQAEQAFLVAAELRASRAQLARMRDADAPAAELFLEAAGLTPESRPRKKAEYLTWAARMFEWAMLVETRATEKAKYGDQALKAFHRAVAALETGLGEDHPETAGALERLALMYLSLSRHEEAQQHYRRALAIYEAGKGEQGEGGGPPAMARVLNSLSFIYALGGRYDEAAAALERALAIPEATSEESFPSKSGLLSELGGIYEIQGRHEEAEACYKRSLALREEAHGKDHFLVASSLDSLASLYERQGRIAEAEPLIKRSLAIREAGESELAIALALQQLARIYRKQRRYKDAAPLLERALAIYEAAYGKDDLNLQLPLEELGYIYELQQRYAEAESLYKRAIETVEGYEGYNPDLAQGLQFLARLYIKQRRYKDAGPLLKRALAIVEACPAVRDYHPATEHMRKTLKAVEACRQKPENCAESREIGRNWIFVPTILPWKGGCSAEPAEQ